jgi:hypothetical protein
VEEKTMKARILTALALLPLFVCAVAAPARSQVLYSSIVGNVTDATGAAVPGAAVTLTHNDRKVSRETVTDSVGAYTFSTIQPGTYTLIINLPGFRSYTNAGVAVTLNNVTRVDVALQIGELAESVLVAGEAPLLQTDRAEVRAELNSRQLANLPVPPGRNYQQLFKTLPGFTPPENAHSVPSNPSRSLVFNVNGASQSSNSTRIDGVSTTNIWLPHISAYVPALESIETVNAVTNSFDAEQGLAGGSAINVQIKSGTNHLRGSLFEFYNNERLRARNYFTPPDKPKGKFTYNQYGGTAGGPIVRDKLFYFFSYEGTKDHQNVNRTASVPTAGLRTGNLSASTNPIYDPSTGNADGSNRTPFPGNVIPSDRIDPIVKKILPLIPLPNITNADGSVPELNNYFVSAPFLFDRWTIDTKVNWNASQNLNLFGRYSVLDFYTVNGTVFGDRLQGPPIGGGNPGTGQGKTHSVSVGGTYTFTPSLIMDAHVGFVRMNTAVEHSDIGSNAGLDFLGIPGTNGPRRFEGGFPYMDIPSYSPYGISETYMPYIRSDDQYQYVANVNWLKARHNVRFGTDIYYQALNHTQPEFVGDSLGARGGFRFGTGPTQIKGGPSGTNFNNWATFLLGVPTLAGRLLETEAPYTTRTWQYSMYARDQWEITPKMTFTYGTRWEYFPVPGRANRGLERYNVNTNMMEIGGLGAIPNDLGVRVSKTLFAPRLGWVYRPTSKLVLRSGFGITNDPYSLARPLRTNHPVLLNLNVAGPNSLAFASRLADGIPPIATPDLGNGIINVPTNVAVVTLPDTFDRGYIQSWNVAVQRELPGAMAAEVAYVGTRQVRQLGFRELNWSPIDGGRIGRQLFATFARDASTRMVAPVGNSHYNALQARLDRRFADGFQFGVTYTLSRSIGIAGSDNSDGTPRIAIPQFYYLNEALSGFDRTHNLQITNITELPFGRNRRWLNGGGLAAAIAGGWQVNATLSFYSGRPFSVSASGTSLNAPESTQMADQVRPSVDMPRGIGRGQSYFDPLAFRPVTEARFGNAGFNTLRGPGYANMDFGLFREFRFGERSIQLRMEAFNLTDTPHFDNPSDSGRNASNLQLNPDGSIRNLNGFSEISSSYGERQVRVGLRFGF